MIYGAGQTVSGVLGVHEMGYSPSVEDGAILGIPVKYAKIQRVLICNGGAKDARILAQKLQGGGALVIGGQNMGAGWECTAATGDENGKVTAEFRRLLTPFDMLPGGWGMTLNQTAKTATLTFNGTPKWIWEAEEAFGEFRWGLKFRNAAITGNFTGDDVFPTGVRTVALTLGGEEVWAYNPLWSHDGAGHGTYTGGNWQTPQIYSGTVAVDSGLTEIPIILYWDAENETWKTRLRYTFGYYQDVYREKAREWAKNAYTFDAAIGEDGNSRGVATMQAAFPLWPVFASGWPTLSATVTLRGRKMGNADAGVAGKVDAAENGLRWRWTDSLPGGSGWQLVYFGWVHFAITEAGAVVAGQNMMGGEAA